MSDPLAPARELLRWLFQADKEVRMFCKFIYAAEVRPLLLICGIVDV